MKSKANLAIVTVTVILTGLACSYLSKGGGAYTSATDKFSVAFPAGGDVKTEPSKAKFATSGTTYSTNFDNRSDNYRSFEVNALDIPSATASGKDSKDILKIGLNGWDDEPGTVIKDVTINGQKAIDSVRTVEVGPAKMTFREVVFWSEKDKKLYVVQVAAVKKDNVSTKEADDFVNSFKINS